ncbi:MAG: fibronectin type III domain-containing protein, partial [candidate division Zixibacteria bacterium]|nr:fibronectin type III domain-containing protein [candidate division Zixibacteria bacterium]
IFHQRANLSWKTNRDENSAILGYNIYVSPRPVLGTPDETELRVQLKPIHETPYAGDTSPGFAVETFAMEGLTNGQSYFVFVTTIYPGNVESAPSNEIEVIPRPEGRFVLRPSFSGNQGGFSFRRVKSILTDDLANDIYLAQIDDKLYVASPARIDNVLRKTCFFHLGRYAPLEEVRLTEMKMPSSDKLQVISGQVFLLQDQDSCYALLKFDRVDPKEKKVNLSYIYQAKPNRLQF